MNADYTWVEASLDAHEKQIWIAIPIPNELNTEGTLERVFESLGFSIRGYSYLESCSLSEKFLCAHSSPERGYRWVEAVLVHGLELNKITIPIPLEIDVSKFLNEVLGAIGYTISQYFTLDGFNIESLLWSEESYKKDVQSGGKGVIWDW